MMVLLELHHSIGKRLTMLDLVPPRPDLVPDELPSPRSTSSLCPLSKRGRGRGQGGERE
jgi:hypothetical protein